MNNSQLTTEIAHGLYLWALVQNLSDADMDACSQKLRLDWTVWASRNLRFVEAVKREQFALFDRCLNGTLGR